MDAAKYAHRDLRPLILVGVLVVASCTPAAVSSSTTAPLSTTTSTSPEVRPVPDSPVQGEAEDGDDADVTPITGYGDFSDVDYFLIDWVEVTQRVVQCANDQGFPVEVIPPGDGISFQSVPRQQNQAAAAAVEACEAGLNLPPPEPMSEEMIGAFFLLLLDVEQCLEEEFGYDIPDAPSLDTFVESWATGP